MFCLLPQEHSGHIESYSDGVIDGMGPLADFQTFSGLTRV